VKLKSFQVENFRSIANSGEIRVDKITTLVGRNESGKSNLLLALESLNPPSGRKPLSPIKNFPRDRRLSECNDKTHVVTTFWELEPQEQEELGKIFPGAESVTEVKITRYYNGECLVVLEVPRPELDFKWPKGEIRRLTPYLKNLLDNLSPEAAPPVESAWTAFQETTEQISNTKEWAAQVARAAGSLRQVVVNVGVRLPGDADEILGRLEEKAEDINTFDKAHEQASIKVLSWLPRFIYIDEFPDLNGHQNVTDYFNRKNSGQQTDADKNFEKLAKVAGFDPAELQRLLNQDDHETRNQLVNRAGAVITAEIRRLWKDRDLKIRFNLDAHHFDTLISDPNRIYDVEVNLDERSRGFKWFFSFYVSFAADTDGGHAEGAILLLDEPGLFLHATSQADLLKHLWEDFNNQIIYTTHSPFMVPADAIGTVRTVNIAQDKGTHVTNDPTGDSRTLFPLQAALGYYLSQTLFVGNANLVIEGITDFWILSSVNAHLRAAGKVTIPDELVITPAGGAPRVSYMVALLVSERLDVLVLLDDDDAGRRAKKELVNSKLIRDGNILFVTEAFAGSSVRKADIEDLIEPSIYDALVQESYKAELSQVNLNLNPHIPRIVKRYEDAFKIVGLDFQKTRPARLFMTKAGNEPDKVLTAATLSCFEKLFQSIAHRLDQHKKAGREPFH
jgi:predicted ATPase